MYKVQLEQISSLHENVRTKTTIGIVQRLPTVGERFTLVARSLENSGDFRIINTSEVQEVFQHSEDFISFRTENSVYHLTLIEGDEDV